MRNRMIRIWMLVIAIISISIAAGRSASCVDQVKTEPLSIRVENAFPNLRFDRPIVLTNAGDGSNRIFVAQQKGKILFFKNKAKAEELQQFIDLEDRVVYKDKENEEGLLGFAFHPKYQSNGQFFVYYTTKDAPHTSVVSRFRVSKDDPNRADPKSEQEILRIKQPYWNHNGGTIEFGPDGYLYIALGDGGAGRDPHGNGQNLGTLLGSILRIDIDRKSVGKNYAIPKDNPFVDRKGARPEIWAYGLRNVWRFSFDRKTGSLWAADVGQDIWEEINIIRRGGNYGWNRREAKHPFDKKGAKASRKYIDPIWEYHHDIGKSITGGSVYRGKKVPKLWGLYLYADYVSGRLWALKYNEKTGRVEKNYRLEGNNLPIMSYGEDEQGEVYYLCLDGSIYHFRSTGK